ncbi:MAG: hypothetical protein N3I35_03095 [Clostridia bacterium]|nr:hypothetical protein [Clostridia bacterium]
MGTYTLTVTFNPEDLSIINKAEEKLVFVKLYADPTPYTKHIVWVAVKPFQNNVFEWSPEYSVFCSLNDIEEGSVIRVNSIAPSIPGKNYKFADNMFENPVSQEGLDQEEYMITNNQREPKGMVFGLAQSARANQQLYSQCPTTGVYLPYSQYSLFKPVEYLCILLSSQVENGSVIKIYQWQSSMGRTSNSYVSRAQSKAFKIAFSSNQTQKTVKYNGSRGEFEYIAN